VSERENLLDNFIWNVFLDKNSEGSANVKEGNDKERRREEEEEVGK